MALLEVLVSITLLVVAGSGWISLARQTADSLSLAIEHEEQVREASIVLARYTRLPAAEIGRAAGRRRAGTLELRISILEPGLFDVWIHEPQTGRTILGTTLYRVQSDTSRAP